MADDRAAILVADDGHAVVGFATVYLDIVSVRFGLVIMALFGLDWNRDRRA